MAERKVCFYGRFDKENFSIDSGRQAGKGVPLQEGWPGKVC